VLITHPVVLEQVAKWQESKVRFLSFAQSMGCCTHPTLGSQTPFLQIPVELHFLLTNVHKPVLMSHKSSVHGFLSSHLLIVLHPVRGSHAKLVQLSGFPQFVSLYLQTPFPFSKTHFPVRHFEVELHTIVLCWQTAFPLTTAQTASEQSSLGAPQLIGVLTHLDLGLLLSSTPSCTHASLVQGLLSSQLKFVVLHIVPLDNCVQTFKIQAFSVRGQLALNLQVCIPFCNIQTPPVPQPAGSTGGQIKPALATHCPERGSQIFLAQVVLETFGQGLSVKTHFPDPESQAAVPHPVEVQFKVLRVLSSAHVGTPFGATHFLREQGESPGQEI